MKKKKTLKVIASSTMISSLVLSAMATPIMASEGWNQVNGSWTYESNGSKQTGWSRIGNSWFSFDKNGNMQTGWTASGEFWYWLSPGSGVMQDNGWITDGSNQPFFIEPNGVMATDTVKDGYEIKADGTRVLLSDSNSVVLGAEGLPEGTVVEGNLYVTADAAKNLELKGITVKGKLVIEGGQNVKLTDSNIQGLKMNQADAVVTLSGKTEVKNAELTKQGILEGDKNYKGEVKNVKIASLVKEEATIAVKTDTITSKSWASLSVKEDSKNLIISNETKLNIGKDVVIDKIVADAPVVITGEGKVIELEANSDGVKADVPVSKVTGDNKGDVTNTEGGVVEKPSTGGGSSGGSGGGSVTPEKVKVKSVSVIDGADGITEVTQPVVGQVIRANITLSNGTIIGTYPVNEKAKYEWYYAESTDNIIGTESSFTVTSDNVGKTICVKVTIDGIEGVATWIASGVVEASQLNSVIAQITSLPTQEEFKYSNRLALYQAWEAFNGLSKNEQSSISEDLTKKLSDLYAIATTMEAGNGVVLTDINVSFLKDSGKFEFTVNNAIEALDLNRVTLSFNNKGVVEKIDLSTADDSYTITDKKVIITLSSAKKEAIEAKIGSVGGIGNSWITFGGGAFLTAKEVPNITYSQAPLKYGEDLPVHNESIDTVFVFTAVSPEGERKKIDLVNDTYPVNAPFTGYNYYLFQFGLSNANGMDYKIELTKPGDSATTEEKGVVANNTIEVTGRFSETTATGLYTYKLTVGTATEEIKIMLNKMEESVRIQQELADETTDTVEISEDVTLDGLTLGKNKTITLSNSAKINISGEINVNGFKITTAGVGTVVFEEGFEVSGQGDNDVIIDNTAKVSFELGEGASIPAGHEWKEDQFVNTIPLVQLADKANDAMVTRIVTKAGIDYYGVQARIYATDDQKAKIKSVDKVEVSIYSGENLIGTSTTQKELSKIFINEYADQTGYASTLFDTTKSYPSSSWKTTYSDNEFSTFKPDRMKVTYMRDSSILYVIDEKIELNVSYTDDTSVVAMPWDDLFDNEAPGISGVSMENDENGNLVLTVTATDNGTLRSLEVDHSLEKILPEFTLYNVDEYDFEGEFEGVKYTCSEGTWKLTFNASVSDLIRSNVELNKKMTFYFVIKDIVGNHFGSMDPTNQDNTFEIDVPSIDDLEGVK